MQLPGYLVPTLLILKPFFSNSVMYHGFRPAERRSTLPPTLRARYNVCTCNSACESVGSNQSILSMIYGSRCQPRIAKSQSGDKAGAYDGVTESAFSDTSNDFLKLISMDAKSVKGSRPRQLPVRSRRQVLRVTSKQISTNDPKIKYLESYLWEYFPCRQSR